MQFCLTELYAQQFGEITGTITDATGAVLVGGVVTATNTATDLVRNATTNSSGVYALPNLPPGIYNLRAEKAGFKVSVRAGVEVQVDDVIRGDFALQLGDVTVRSRSREWRNRSTRNRPRWQCVVAAREIVDLHLNGRDYLHSVTLSALMSGRRGTPAPQVCRAACAQALLSQ